MFKKDIIGFEPLKPSNLHDNRFGVSMLASFKLAQFDMYKYFS
jgi:hypothetical protein